MSSREEIEKQIAELSAVRNGNLNLLAQNDYRARKMIAEVCGIVKEKFGLTDEEMPVYAKYCELERQAQQFRDDNKVLEAKIEELEKELQA